MHEVLVVVIGVGPQRKGEPLSALNIEHAIIAFIYIRSTKYSTRHLVDACCSGLLESFYRSVMVDLDDMPTDTLLMWRYKLSRISS